MSYVEPSGDDNQCAGIVAEAVVGAGSGDDAVVIGIAPMLCCFETHSCVRV